jgi:ribonuclease Z
MNAHKGRLACHRPDPARVGAVHLTFLGTSAGTPTRTRNVTSQVLTLDHGGVWMLDAGEGTQHQLMKAGISARRIERILVTHLHGDHCYGLPGLLALIAIHERREPVTLIGPRGLAEFIATITRLSDLTLKFNVVVQEHGGSGEWVAEHGWHITARPLVHRIACSGYVLQEPARAGLFHPERARALGLPEGRAWGRLQRGETVNGIAPAQVCDPPRPGRKLVLLGDTCDAGAIIAAGSDCDLLVCEATYTTERAAKAHEWGHLTAAETGALAHAMRARALAITHFSSRYTTMPGALDALSKEAADACPDTVVFTADDLLTLDLALDGRVALRA